MPASKPLDIPQIPPRPKRTKDRSISPNRDTFARSPLNDPSFHHDTRRGPNREHRPPSNPPSRPPSVSLPSIGQEGNEYASLEELAAAVEDPEHRETVSGDLPLHAPTASVPQSIAKKRISTVTRTDSDQAAKHGIGISRMVLEATEKVPHGLASSAKSGASSTQNSRPTSLYKDKDDEEHGIPVIGVQVPMYPNAGDVQAPTPSPMPSAPSTGVGFFNNGGQPRNHTRSRSGRHLFNGPPGSYGLHGHGLNAKDHFEKDWYEKHPEDKAREQRGEYGPAIAGERKEYHLSSEDLNRLVHSDGNNIDSIGAFESNLYSQSFGIFNFPFECFLLCSLQTRS